MGGFRLWLVLASNKYMMLISFFSCFLALSRFLVFFMLEEVLIVFRKYYRCKDGSAFLESIHFDMIVRLSSSLEAYNLLKKLL